MMEKMLTMFDLGEKVTPPHRYTMLIKVILSCQIPQYQLIGAGKDFDKSYNLCFLQNPFSVSVVSTGDSCNKLHQGCKLFFP